MDYKYEKDKNGYIAIRKYVGTDKNVVVPKYIDGGKVIYLSESTFAHNNDIECVTFQDNITDIEVNQFAGCTNLKKVVLPNTIERIEYGAFSGCNKLEEITLPESLLRIGSFAFSSCLRLKKIFIPKNVSKIDDSIFCYCNGLESIVVDKDNPNYDSRNDCNAIIYSPIDSLIIGCHTTIIPNTVRFIGKKAFTNCETLERIYIPKNIEVIKDGVFEGCFRLKTVEFEDPSNLVFIDIEEFSECAHIEDFIVHSDDVPHILGKIIILYAIEHQRPNMILEKYTKHFYEGEFKYYITVAQETENVVLIHKLIELYYNKFGGDGLSI